MAEKYFKITCNNKLFCFKRFVNNTSIIEIKNSKLTCVGEVTSHFCSYGRRKYEFMLCSMHESGIISNLTARVESIN